MCGDRYPFPGKVDHIGRHQLAGSGTLIAELLGRLLPGLAVVEDPSGYDVSPDCFYFRKDRQAPFDGIPVSGLLRKYLRDLRRDAVKLDRPAFSKLYRRVFGHANFAAIGYYHFRAVGKRDAAFDFDWRHVPERFSHCGFQQFGVRLLVLRLDREGESNPGAENQCGCAEKISSLSYAPTTAASSK